MRKHKAEVSCTAGAAKPDSGQAGGGEDFMRQHEAEVPNSPNGNSVNIGRHAAILEKKGSATINYHPGTLIQEPAISKAEIERVSSCPLPELDTGSKNLILRGTLTEAIDWKIFATCTLKSWHLMDLSQDLDEDEERYLFQAYPAIEPTNSYHDAFEFIVMAVLTSLYQNTGAGLSPDEQLGFFERVFLVTKLRTLTQLEKTSVEENLRRHGLYVPLKNYILNWYISNTYFKYFNYSKNPDGGYKAARLWGMIQDSSGQPATGASYRLIDANISGHALSGKTGGRQTRLNRLRILLPKEETRYARLTGTSPSTFAYNMELQFYLPIEQFKKDMAGEVTSTTITPHPTVSVLVEAPGYVSITKKIPLKHRFTHPDFPEPALRNDVVVQMLPTGITVTNIPSDVLETRASTVEVRGMVRGLGAITSLSYTFRGSTRSIALDANNQFQLDLRLPVTSDQTAYLLQLKAVDSLGPALETQKVIIYVPEFAPDEVVVRFQPSTTQNDIDDLIANDLPKGSRVTDSFERIKLYQISLPAGSDVLAQVIALRKNKLVARVLPNFYFPNEDTHEDTGEPNDTYYPDDNGNPQQKTQLANMKIEEAWRIITGTNADDPDSPNYNPDFADDPLIVAVMDSGVNWWLPDIRPNIWQNLGEDADNDGRTIECDDENTKKTDPKNKIAINGNCPNTIKNDQNGWELDPGDLDTKDNDNNGYKDDLIGWNIYENSNEIKDYHSGNGHGTLAAHIIGAVGDNEKGITGVNWNVKIIPIVMFSNSIAQRKVEINGNEVTYTFIDFVKLLNDENDTTKLIASGEVLHFIKTFAYAADMRADLISGSFGIFLEVTNQIELDNIRALENLMKDVNNLSTLYVASAGNDNNNMTLTEDVNGDGDPDAINRWSSTYWRFPQHVKMPNKIIVAAVDSADNKTSFSNYSSDGLVEIAALGKDVPSIGKDGKFAKVSGTSYAAPLVVGTASLVIARYPEVRGQSLTIKKHLIKTADRLNGTDGTPDLTGYIKDGRRLNVFKAVGGDQADSPELSTFLLGNRHIPNTVSTRTGKYSIPGIYGNDKHLIACDIGEDDNGDQDIIIPTGPLTRHTESNNLLLGKPILLINENRKFIDESHRLTASDGTPLGPQNLLGGDCGDVDNDGDNDLILASFITESDNFQASTTKNILLINNGSGVFHKAPDSSLPNIYDNSRDADFVDIDNDNDLDIFVSNSTNQQFWSNGKLQRRDRSNVLLLNDGNLNDGIENFSDVSDRLPAENPVTGAGNGSSHNAHVIDINKDGCQDIYVANQISRLSHIIDTGIDQFFINQKSGDNCTGYFADEALSLGILAGRNQGRDSSKDMVNDGQSSDLLERGDSAHEARFSDIDKDGDDDLIIARRANESNLIYINNGMNKETGLPYFTNSSNNITNNLRLSTSTLDVGDLTGDGCPDIIFGNGDLNTFEAYQDQMYVNTIDSTGKCTGRFQEMGNIHNIPQHINTTKDILFFDADQDCKEDDVWFGNFGEIDWLLINEKITGRGKGNLDCVYQ